MGIGENIGEGIGENICSSGLWRILNIGVEKFIAFSDLISGPSTGLGDSVGSGVIVTVWGYNLGSTQGTSTALFTDSASTERSCEVYYWKNADGLLPGAPANLYESHGMQEVAFSIPASAIGAGTIRLLIKKLLNWQKKESQRQ